MKVEIVRYLDECVVSFTVPIRTVSEMNQSRHQHWATKKRRVDKQRATTLLCLLAADVDTTRVPYAVTMTRIAPRALDDDNLRSALKAVRDAIAYAYSVDDGVGGPIRWHYAQRSGGVRTYAVGIEIHKKCPT